MPRLASVVLCLGIVATFLSGGTSAALGQEKVGVSSAVNPQASSTPPGRPTRQLVLGQDLVFNERISTGEGGQTQVLFLDQSSMSVGPNSDLVIDQFVYDPKRGGGKLAMSATKGVLRYIGGKLSKQDQAVTLRTSTATLAVRGGAFILNIQANGQTDVIFIFGDGLTISSLNGLVETIRRAGFAVTISSNGNLSPPAPVSPTLLAQLTALLDGRTGGTGGAPVVPTETTVLSSGIDQTISGNVTQSIQQASAAETQTNPTPTDGTQNGTNTSTSTSTSSSTGQTTGTAFDCLADCPNGSNPAGNISNQTTPTAISYAGRAKITADPSRGYFDQSAANNAQYPSATSSSGTLQNGVFSATIANLGDVNFQLLPGSNSVQANSSAFGTLTGTTFLSNDGSYFYASLTPNGQPNQRVLLYGGIPVSSSFYQPTGSTRIFAFTVRQDNALQSNMPFVRPEAGGNLANASVSPLYVAAPATTPIGNADTHSAARALQVSLGISGQGVDQRSAIAVTTGTFNTQQSSGQPVLTGEMRGSSLMSSTGSPVALRSSVSSTLDGNNTSLYGSNQINGFVLDQAAYTGTPGSGIVGTPVQSTAQEAALGGGATTYGFAQPATPTTVPNAVANGTRTTQALNGYFGGLMYPNSQTNPYIVTGSTVISTDQATNRVQATLKGTAQSPSGNINSLQMEYGGLTGDAGGRQAFIDDNNFAALETQDAQRPQQVNGQPITYNGDRNQAGQLYLVSSGAAGTPLAVPAPGYCDCQYLKWGYWGGDLRTGSDANPASVQRAHINTWVAGSVPTSLTDMTNLMNQLPTSAAAKGDYSGHAIGSVYNNGISSVATGGFNGSYNFATQTGTVNVTDFGAAGNNFSTTGQLQLAGPNKNMYGFTATGTGPQGVPFQGTVNGAFYGPNAAETGGNFTFQSIGAPSILASGIYAGRK